MKNFRGVMFLLACAFMHVPHLFADSQLTAYPGSVLVDSEVNDGDSFTVSTGSSVIHLRLYFADCPEKVVLQSHDARRVQEQAGYFGYQDPSFVKSMGARAAEFTKEILSEPFTVYTSHAKALGGRTSERIYGFVVTADGKDLGELLVEQGYARNFGVSRQNYKGDSLREVENRMRDLESAAMLARRGVWEQSNPDLVVKYREIQRQEKEELNLLMTMAVGHLDKPIDINSADQLMLEKLPGIGPVTAARIIESRPFRSLEDLKKVRGIGDKMFDSLLPFIRIDETNSVNG